MSIGKWRYQETLAVRQNVKGSEWHVLQSTEVNQHKTQSSSKLRRHTSRHPSIPNARECPERFGAQVTAVGRAKQWQVHNVVQYALHITEYMYVPVWWRRCPSPSRPRPSCWLAPRPLVPLHRIPLWGILTFFVLPLSEKRTSFPFFKS